MKTSGTMKDLLMPRILLVIKGAWKLAFEKGWLAALQALGVLEDSPLRDPSQIPFLSLTPAVQNPLEPIDEVETQSTRELVEQIDSHVELDKMEAISNPHIGDQPGQDILLQPTLDQQPTETATQTQPADPTI